MSAGVFGMCGPSLVCQDIYFIGIVHVFCYHRQKKKKTNNVHGQTVAFPDISMP